MSGDRPIVAVVGVGLIGGSLGMALRRRNLADVVGLGRSEERLALAGELGAVDRFSTQAADVIPGAAHVVVCTPVSVMPEMFKLIGPHLSEGAVVSDAGSTKRSVMSDAARWLPPGAAFAGAHPMAGSDKAGVGAASADLFEGSVCVVVEGASPDAAYSVGKLWQSVGARVVRLAADDHDRLVAASSHLPHACAAALVLAVSATDGAMDLTAGGFADSTRIAASSPGMWRDICMANADELSAALRGYGAQLERFAGMLGSADAEGVLAFFEEAARIREGLEPKV